MINKSILIIISLGIALGIIIFFIIFFSKEFFSAPWAIVAAILAAVGTAYSLYQGISKQLLTRKENVIITYDKILKFKSPVSGEFYQMMYLLRIKKTKGESIAKSVKGYITIEGTDIQNIPLQWYMQRMSSNNIDDFKDLWLFSATQYNPGYNSLFVSHSSDALPNKMFGQRMKDVLHKKITVRIESENAKVPKEPFTETVENIMANSTNMKS